MPEIVEEQYPRFVSGRGMMASVQNHGADLPTREAEVFRKWVDVDFLGTWYASG